MRVINDFRDVVQRIDLTSMTVIDSRRLPGVPGGFELTVDGEPQHVEDVLVALVADPHAVEVTDTEHGHVHVRYEEQG